MNNYIVLKLCIGDQLLAELINETDEGILINNPVQIKNAMLVENNEYGEQTICSKYCPYTNDLEFVFNHKDIIFYKPLNPTLINYYKRLVHSFAIEHSKKDLMYQQRQQQEEQQEALEKESNAFVQDLTKRMKLH